LVNSILDDHRKSLSLSNSRCLRKVYNSCIISQAILDQVCLNTSILCMRGCDGPILTLHHSTRPLSMFSFPILSHYRSASHLTCVQSHNPQTFPKKNKNYQSCNFPCPPFLFLIPERIEKCSNPCQKDERTALERSRSTSQSVTPRRSEALH
jgi:hypothetical protein